MVLVDIAFGASFRDSAAPGMLGNPNCQVCHDAFLLQGLTEGDPPSAVCLNRHILPIALRDQIVELQGDIGTHGSGYEMYKV
jgi:hypothetical protein